MDQKTLQKIKYQLIKDENARKVGWTLPLWVAEQLFEYIEKLEKENKELKKDKSE